MATIGDDLRARADRIRKRSIASGAALLVALVAVQTFTHRLTERQFLAVLIPVMVLFMAAMSRSMKQICCPHCGKPVGSLVHFYGDARYCPFCAADWDEPLDRG